MESRRRRGGVGRGAIVAILAALAAGCGGDSSGSAGETTAAEPDQALSRTELISKADAICVAGQKAFRAASRAAYPHPEQTSVPNPTERLPNVEYSENVVEVAKRIVRQLKALTPPPALRAGYDAYVEGEEEVEDLALAALQASIEDDGGAYFKARKTRDAGALERANLAEAVGLKKCSPNPFFH